MNRRNFLRLSGFAAVGLATGAVAYRNATLPAPSLELLLADLDAMRDRRLLGAGAWTPHMVFTHLTQSVQYAMTGYPALKSAAFRTTVGRAAYFAFSTAGAMRHDLAEPIPGAPPLTDNGTVAEAIDHLASALTRLAAHAGPLQPHFAYGDLDKADYLAAQIYHVRNHLSEIIIS